MEDEVSSFWPRGEKAEALPSTVPMEEILPRQWLDFQRSGALAKIGVIRRDGEVIFPAMPSKKTIDNMFGAKKLVEELVFPDGTRALFDFLRMIYVKFDAGGSVKGIAAFCWVDDDGRFFSPACFGGVDEALVRKAFDTSSEGHLSLTGVRRCRHREARARGFLNRTTWAFGWYGAAPGDLDAAADCGEVRANWQLLDLFGAEKVHGRGLHVSPVGLLRAAACLSRVGAKNSRHARVLYCALAPGMRELVAAGSPQSQPSSSFFHSGTDSLLRTKWYVFWDCTLGTSILPLYDVSFKVTDKVVKVGDQNQKRKRAEADQSHPLQKKTRMI